MMLSTTFPVICTDRFVETVDFYEDVFGLVPVAEVDGYARLQHPDNPALMLAIMDVKYEAIPEKSRKPTQGMILPFEAVNLSKVFETVYHEGLEIIKEPTRLDFGGSYFLVADPYNDVVIQVFSTEEISALKVDAA